MSSPILDGVRDALANHCQNYPFMTSAQLRSLECYLWLGWELIGEKQQTVLILKNPVTGDYGQLNPEGLVIRASPHSVLG